jgi:hypothetical protein
MTPLHEAVVKNCISSVSSLVSSTQPHGNGTNFLGQTPLHLAGLNVEISRVLNQSGHDIDAVDGFGRTPLMYAAALGYTDTVQFLICEKANIFMTDHDLHLNFISHASRRGYWDLIMDALEAIRQSRCPEAYQRLISLCYVGTPGFLFHQNRLEKIPECCKGIILCETRQLLRRRQPHR